MARFPKSYYRIAICALVGLMAQGVNGPACADPVWLTGSSMTVDGSNAPDNFSQTVTLSPGTSTIDNGTLNLKQSIVPESGGAEWLVLDYQTANGSSIAGSTSNSWELQALPILAQPANSLGFYLDWGVSGTLDNVTSTFSGSPGTNPITGSGNVMLNTTACAYSSCSYINTTNNTVNFFAYVNPYSSLTNYGIDTNTANEFQIGVLMQPVAPVPEPDSLVLIAPGVLALGLVSRRRPNRARA